MAEQIRRSSYKGIDPGPWLAKVTNHLDPTYMGCLQVNLIRAVPGLSETETNNIIVRYCPPFFGATSQGFEGNNSSNFNDVQKSYGFWMIPPDIGSTVMVLFVAGDINQGYWIGCVPDTYQNHMVPGIAASQYSAMTEEQLRQYGTRNVPVAEYHKSSRGLEDPNPDKLTKPVHPFADRLVQQGLLVDDIRGVTSSSARREVPSQVFGISTPGPVDVNSPVKPVGFNNGNLGNTLIPTSRLGGHQFVMDDGDKEGKNELLRIRTRTGHQILLHNSSDLIYIGNSKGTAWLEFTSDGKLDVYAADSVSIHTENDFNFRADRDVNIEAGRSINMRALQDMELNISNNFNLIVDNSAKIFVAQDRDETVGQTYRLTVGNTANIGATQNVNIGANGDLSLLSGGNMKHTSGAKFSVSAANQYVETAPEIHMNGPLADPADLPDTADVPSLLNIYTLPNRKITSGWADRNFYKGESIKSIMLRIPTHEPYDQHENVNPDQFKSSSTDITLGPRDDIPMNTSGATSSNPLEVVPGVPSAAAAREIGNTNSKEGIEALKRAAAKLGLTSPYAVASLLGIAGGESRWKLVSENFNYKPDRLLQVFPSVFHGNRALAEQYAANPSSIPELIYGYNTAKGRGLGNTQPGDGAKYIGRGYIQLTGRGNYTRYGKIGYQRKIFDSPTTLVNNPEILGQDVDKAAEVCVLYFLDRVKADQNNPSYFEKAVHAVGFCTPDIYSTKKSFYNTFLAQLQSGK